ncbi:MAG TPA: hypothetical protein VMF08_11580 [Candidatus Sulfotelmatobacter sp.]|nr:hypothetical protein [Candidatus Sulfotelmatobacter sp.]
MKKSADSLRKPPEDIPARIRELDAQMAALDERLEKNKAALERNNTALTAKIAELCVSALKRRTSKG